jgi:hypothetical protein
MKKGFLLAIASLMLMSLAFVSCECPFKDWESRTDEYVYEDGGINYEGDVFKAKMIIGTWGTIGCNPVGYEFKQIHFYSDGECDVVLSFPGSNDWRTETWTYYFVRNTFTLDRGDSYTVFRFTIRKFIYPELYVQDSFSQSQYSKCWVWKKN